MKRMVKAKGRKTKSEDESVRAPQEGPRCVRACPAGGRWKLTKRAGFGHREALRCDGSLIPAIAAPATSPPDPGVAVHSSNILFPLLHPIRGHSSLRTALPRSADKRQKSVGLKEMSPPTETALIFLGRNALA